MNEELLSKITVLSQLFTIVPVYGIMKMILLWLNKQLKKQRDIYAYKSILFCNYDLNNKLMCKLIKCCLALAVIAIWGIVVAYFLQGYIGLSGWIGVFLISCFLQLKILGKENYGLNKYGDKKNYSLCLYIFVGIMDIFVLIANQYYNTWGTAGKVISFLVEAVAIVILTSYVINIKKVTYCERVILDFGYGKERTIAREDLYLEEDGSVIITNQNSSKEQINGSYIRKKTAVYSKFNFC